MATDFSDDNENKREVITLYLIIRNDSLEKPEDLDSLE